MGALHKTSATAIALLRHHTVLPILIDEDVEELQGDERARLIVRAVEVPGTLGSQWSTKFTEALAAKLVISATPATLRSFAGRIDATATSATYYIQLWNLVDVPANATAVTAANGALMAPFKVAHVSGTDDQLVFDFGDAGIAGSAGLVVGLSTTEFTKTAAGAFLSLTAELA
jgi:hypothetical protein